jgi:excisionase family DNA binding protein
VFVDHAAEILGVSRRTIYYRIRQGRLRTVRTRCGSQRVMVDSIEALLREQQERAAKKRRPKKRESKEPGSTERPRETLTPGETTAAGVAADRTTTGTAGVLSTDPFGKSRVLWQQR